MGFIVAASFAFALGGAVMKATDGLHRLWPLVAIAVLFVTGALLLAVAVRAQGLSVAYLVGLGCEAAIAVGIGCWVFDEPLTRGRTIGLLLIAVGILSVRLG